jgi:hypothetical protein
MATRFEVAGPDVTEIIASVVSAYHPQLRDAGVTIEAVLAFAEVDEETGEEVAPAVTVGGYPCAAKIKVMGLADRTLGSADARITIDGKNWEVLGPNERAALIDHETTHLELVLKIKDATEVVQRDDLGRPKLKIRKHDWQMGFFDEIVRRHGAASPEWKQWVAFEEQRKLLWLPYVKASE